MELESQDPLTMEEDGAVGEEKRALMSERESTSDGEVYSAKRCLKAPSFKFALVVSVFVIILLIVIVTALTISLVLTSSSRKKRSDGQRITLDDVFDGRFHTKRYSGQWLPSSPGLFMEFSREGGVVFVDYGNDNEKTTIISADELKTIEESYGTVSAVKPSPSSTPSKADLLLVTNREKVYRHSSLADYYIYTDNGTISKLTDSGMKIHYAEWSPDPDLENGIIAYVMNYNVYVFNMTTGDHTQITEGGTEDGIRYGIPDWVYEEEVVSTDYTLWWSHDGAYLLYTSFDDTQVERYSFPIYGPEDKQYTTIESIPYPKPGTINPTVLLHVVAVDDLDNNGTFSSGSLFEFDHYFIHAGLVGNDSGYVVWLNRTQTYIQYCLYNLSQLPGELDCNMMYSLELPGTWIERQSDDAGIYVDLTSDPIRFLTLINIDNVGHTHLAWIAIDETMEFITSGDYDVTDIVRVAYDGDQIESVVYVAATPTPLDRHVYSHNFKTNQSVCLTCSQDDWNVPESPNPSLPKTCDYFSASCDYHGTHCLFYCAGPGVPFSLVYDVAKTTPILIAETNQVLREVLSNISLPTYEYFEVPSENDGPSLNGRMLLPPEFDPNKKHPVLVYVYGGPNSQTVNKVSMLSSLSRLYYVSHLDVILVSVDGRGTGYRGGSFKYSVFGDLGHLETIDQNRAGKYLQGLSYVEETKLAIYGASYGGYMAAMVGSSGKSVFSSAISQSPVSDWLYYDTIYTERYMNKPNDNYDGYQASSVLHRAARLADVNYLLIHGTGDDNVHFQHTTQLVEALTEADVQFDLMIYTDKDHGLTGGNTARHLIELITDFLKKSFQ